MNENDLHIVASGFCRQNSLQQYSVDKVSRALCVFQYGRSDSYRVATTQDKDDKGSNKKKNAAKDLDELKKEVPLVRCTISQCFYTHIHAHIQSEQFHCQRILCLPWNVYFHVSVPKSSTFLLLPLVWSCHLLLFLSDRTQDVSGRSMPEIPDRHSTGERLSFTVQTTAMCQNVH